jgi:hypothetical protein
MFNQLELPPNDYNETTPAVQSMLLFDQPVNDSTNVEILSKVDQLINLNIIEKLDKLSLLDNLDELKKLSELQALNELKKLSELQALNELKNLDNLSILQSLPNLDIMVEKINNMVNIISTYETQLTKLMSDNEIHFKIYKKIEKKMNETDKKMNILLEKVDTISEKFKEFDVE